MRKLRINVMIEKGTSRRAVCHGASKNAMKKSTTKALVNNVKRVARSAKYVSMRFIGGTCIRSL